MPCALPCRAGTAPGSAALLADGVLQTGDSGESVYVLQQRLADLGFFKGTVSGQYDSLTIQAVQTMRIINNLPSADYADLTLISQLLGQKIIAGRATLEFGFSGYEVGLLQARLQNLQYYTGPLDGNFSDDVMRAVKAVQFQHGLSIDGRAGPATQRALYAANAQTCTPDALKAVTLTTLRSGMSGDAVKILEDQLVSLGYHLALADKTYDGLTTSSIIAFQKRCGLSQTGVADIMTQLRLYDEMAKTSLSIYKYGSRGTSVQRIQTRLNQLGFNCGKVDGSFGSKTQNAIRNFQTQAGLPADGQAAWTTLARLFDAGAPQAPATVAPVTAASASVIDVEARLVELGYLYAIPDGITNSMTVNAIKAFQRRCGLSQTGSLNSSTQNRLFSATAPVSTAVYKYGSRGTTVKYIQTRLNQLGFSCGRVDGSFGSKTRAAVKAFQTKAGLKVTGAVNYATAAALFAAAAPRAN
jgi:peptidoglycan hydrolase-like protein with peptidoglycan-binding domain